MQLPVHLPLSRARLLLVPAMLALMACNGDNSTTTLPTLPDSSFQLDPSFNPTGSIPGVVTTILGDSSDTAQAMAIQSDGKIVTAGSTWTGSSFDIAVLRYNSDGTLDTNADADPMVTFGLDGKVTTDIGGTTDAAYAMAIQGDGKIVVAGYSLNFGTLLNEFVVVRYNSDGSLDTTFSTTGIAKVSPSRGGNEPPVAGAGASQNVSPGAAVTLTGSASDYDGTIFSYLWTQTGGPAVALTNDTTAVATFTAPMVGANTLLSFQLVVTDNFGNSTTATTSVTVTPSGNPPPVVNTGNSRIANASTTASLTATATDPGGTIASYAWTQTAGPAVTLTNANAATASFTAPAVSAKTTLVFQIVVTDNLGATTTGTTSVTVSPAGAHNVARAIALQDVSSDIKIVVAGAANNGVDSDMAMVRFNSNGTLDTGFGVGGVVIMEVNTIYSAGAPVDDAANAVVIDSSNKIVIAGTSDSGAVAARLNTDGSLDTSFGNGTSASGITLLDTMSRGSALVIQPDGKPVVGGADGGGVTDMAVARLTTAGALDVTFNAAGVVPGVVTTSFLANRNDEVTSLVLQTDGKIIAGGGAGVGIGYDFALVRYNTDGTLDTSFGLGGKVTTPIGINNDAIAALALQSTGEIVAAGGSWANGRWTIAVARYLP